MRLRTLGRHFREAFRSLWRNGWMTFASISTVAITLLMLGVFVLLALNLNYIAQTVESQVEVRVFLEMDTTDEQIKALEEQIRQIPEVSVVDFIPREEGLQQLKEDFGEQGDLLQGLEGKENPLPDAFVVKTRVPQDTVKVAQLLERMEHVERVRYGRDVVERLFTITEIARNVGIVLIAGLAFTAMFLIANTIKLTILARRKEIEVMKLVGATNGFIRWPFFIEGALLGIFGSILPLAVLIAGYRYLTENMPFMFIQLLPLNPLGYQLAVLLLSIGVFIGIWGSMTSVRKYLRV